MNAYKEGREARESGYAINMNPYCPGRRKYEQWQDGWRDMDEELDEELDDED